MQRAIDEGLSHRLPEACGCHYVARAAPLEANGSIARGTKRFVSDINVLIAAQFVLGRRVVRMAEGVVASADA